MTMNNQRGGAVNGWLLGTLIVLSCASAYMNWYQYQHRTIEIKITLPEEKKQPSSKVSDEYSTHTFPEGRGVCTGFDTICWIRI
jgi:hypothetical protein